MVKTMSKDVTITMPADRWRRVRVALYVAENDLTPLERQDVMLAADSILKCVAHQAGESQ